MKKINCLLILVICIVTGFNAFAKPFPQSNNFYLINYTAHKHFHAQILYKNGYVTDTTINCFFNLNKDVCAAPISDNHYAKGAVMKMAISAASN